MPSQLSPFAGSAMVTSPYFQIPPPTINMRSFGTEISGDRRLKADLSPGREDEFRKEARRRQQQQPTSTREILKQRDRKAARIKQTDKTAMRVSPNLPYFVDTIGNRV